MDGYERKVAMGIEGLPSRPESAGEIDSVVFWVNEYTEAGAIDPSFGYNAICLDIKHRVETESISVDTAIEIKRQIDIMFGRSEE